MVQKAPILVGSTGPVFAPYWFARLSVGCSKARTASARAHTAFEGGNLPKPAGYTYGFMLYWDKNRKNTQRTGNACDNCIAGG